MNLLRSLFFAALAANGAEGFVAPSPRVVESASVTRLQAFGGKKKAAAPAKSEAPKGIVRGFSKQWNPTPAKNGSPAPVPAKKAAVKASGGFKFGGGAGKKPAAAKKAAAPAKAKGGFKFGGGAGKKAAAPAKATSEKPKGIVRGFSKQWNPTVPKSDEGGIKRGFSKQYNSR